MAGASKKSKKGSAKAKAKAGTKSVDVRSPSDIPAFNDLLKKNGMTIVLVYADYCGHCKTYKQDVWNNLKTLPNRGVGLGSIHYDQVENAGLGSAKINGYPSILLLGKDKEPAEFEEDGESTNALPDARNTEMMTRLITEEPSESVRSLPMMTKAPNVSNKVLYDSAATSAFGSADAFKPVKTNSTTPEFDSKANANRNKKSNAAVNNILSRTRSKMSGITQALEPISVPNTAADVLDTQTRADGSNSLVFETASTEEPKAGKGSVVGGSLYSSLLQAARDVAPAVALTTAAVAVSRRKRSTRRLRAAPKSRKLKSRR